MKMLELRLVCHRMDFAVAETYTVFDSCTGISSSRKDSWPTRVWMLLSGSSAGSLATKGVDLDSHFLSCLFVVAPPSCSPAFSASCCCLCMPPFVGSSSFTHYPQIRSSSHAAINAVSPCAHSPMSHLHMLRRVNKSRVNKNVSIKLSDEQTNKQTNNS